MESHPGKGVMKEEKFLNSRKPSQWQVCGEFWNLRGQHNRGWGCGGVVWKPTEYVSNCNS